jgi:gliding motility-associated-like protein
MKYCYLILLLLLPWSSSAQQAATTWHIGNGMVLDFGATPMQVGASAGAPAQEGATTYTDAAGRIRLFVTFRGIYGGNGQLLPGGQFLDYSSPERTIIIAQPGSQGNRCYVFYLGTDRSSPPGAGTGPQLNYSLVDLTANNGTGAIVSISQQLVAGTHGAFTVLAQCSNDEFWVVCDADRNVATGSDQILAFRVTAAPLPPQPVAVVSIPVPIGHSYSYKFSPAGEQLVFNYNGNLVNNVPVSGCSVATFNSLTGEVSNVIRLAASGWATEFSASGRMLYLVKPDTVLQFDVSSRNAAQMLASRKVVRTGIGNGFYRSAQLAPDGRIYLDSIGISPQLAVINFPERSGAAADFTPRGLVLPRTVHMLPRTVPQLLYAPPIRPDAGPDVVVCEGESAQLRGVPMPVFAQGWAPGTYLSATNTATPTFRYTGSALTDTLRLAYALTFFDGTCTRQDLMRVTVLPRPPVPVISGSQSVCPGVEAVEYRVPTLTGYTYRWAVTGGTIVGGQGTASVQVTWAATNPAARVQLVMLNGQNCPGPPAVLPVRVNVVLQTPMPQGPTPVCFTQGQALVYEVVNTAGSVYTWTAQGGRIASGQGSSRVTVAWAGPGIGALQVAERSTTVDTVCFGDSAPLLVTVFRDSTRGQLTAASIGPGTDTESTLTWAFTQIPSNTRSQLLLRRVAGATAWLPVASLPPAARIHRDQAIDADQTSYEYLLRAYNACDEPLEVPLHRTVRLTVLPPSGTGTLALAWNPYQGWPTGVTGYELWRRLDAESTFTRLRQLSGNTLQVSDMATTVGFDHHYRIRALTAGAEAWSNTLDLVFEHALIIPNVFTPNGDGYNDTFFIPNLAVLYPDNVLVMYSRWGQKIYEQQFYKGEWAASTTAGGIYHYDLYIRQLNKHFKGWVEVMK